MQIFSYIFYTLSKIYRAGLDKLNPDIYACGVLTFLQGLNIYSIIFPYLATKNQHIIFWVIISIGLHAVNTIFFNRKTLEKFDQRWDNEPKELRFIKRLLVILYVIISFALPVMLYMKPIVNYQ